MENEERPNGNIDEFVEQALELTYAWSGENLKEGWDLFDIDSTGILEIQRDDEAGIFESDEDAVSYVRAKAWAGSKRHQWSLRAHDTFERQAQEYRERNNLIRTL